MRFTFGCIALFMLIVCCWQCMGMPKGSKKRPPSHESHSHGLDSHESHDHEPHTHEPHSRESHSHRLDSHESHDHEPHSHESHSHESHSHESHSHEKSSSKEKDSSSSEEHSASKEKGRACRDGKRNKKETDIDCGGKKCSPCANGKKCSVNRDCMSKICKNGICTQPPTRKPIIKTTTQAITTTDTEIPMSTTTTEEIITTPEELTTTTEELMSTTTTEELTTTTEDPVTTTPEEIKTTPEELMITPEEIISVTNEEAFEATTQLMVGAEPICNPACQNGGICSADNICTCPADFSGSVCEVQSVGLCLDEESFDVEPILNVTFGKGSRRFSLATPSEFNFTTTYTQRLEPYINDGYFAFINSVYNHYDGWHTGARDHTGDENGYMYVVNANFEPGQFYSGRVDNLCVGLRYEFSVYLANICKKANRIDPNVLFEVRSVEGNELLAQLNSGNVPERDTLTWEKYGISFIATHSSVNLLMISNTRGGSGNDIVIDDIALRVCAHKGSGFCPSK